MIKLKKVEIIKLYLMFISFSQCRQRYNRKTTRTRNLSLFRWKRRQYCFMCSIPE